MSKRTPIGYVLLAATLISYVIPAAIWGVTKDFKPRNDEYWTGYIKRGSGYEKIDGSIYVGYADNPWPSPDFNYRGWATFDINDLPADACISLVELLGNCLINSTDDHSLLAWGLSEYPPGATASALYDDIVAGDWYNSCAGCMRTTGAHSMQLVRGANSALESAAQGSGFRWFAVGFTDVLEDSWPGFWFGHDQGEPVLRVTYSVPPRTAPTPDISVDSVCSDVQFCVTWDAVSGASSYEIRESGGQWIGTGTNTTKCYVKSTVGNYGFAVRAVNSCGVGPSSPDVSIEVTTTTAAPANVWTVNSTQCVNQRYTVHWDPIVGADSYEIREDNGTWTNEGTNVRKTFNHKFGGKHTYSVRALNGCGAGPARTSSLVRVLDKPATPSAPQASNITPCPNESVTISWPEVTNATQYRLTEGARGTIVYSGTDSAWTASLSTGSYAYRLAVFNNCGWSDVSEPLAIRSKQPLATPGAPISNPDPAVVGEPYTISWTPVAGATQYELYEQGESGTIILVYRGSQLQTSMGKPSPGQFVYSVKACGECGCSNKGAELALSVDIQTDVEEIESLALPGSFALSQNYPNPFNPETRIEFSLKQAAHVELVVYNIVGETIRLLVNDKLTAGYKSISWDGRDNSGRLVSSGVYLYRLTANDFTETKKMMLIK